MFSRKKKGKDDKEKKGRTMGRTISFRDVPKKHDEKDTGAKTARDHSDMSFDSIAAQIRREKAHEIKFNTMREKKSHRGDLPDFGGGGSASSLSRKNSDPAMKVRPNVSAECVSGSNGSYSSTTASNGEKKKKRKKEKSLSKDDRKSSKSTGRVASATDITGEDETGGEKKKKKKHRRKMADSFASPRDDEGTVSASDRAPGTGEESSAGVQVSEMDDPVKPKEEGNPAQPGGMAEKNSGVNVPQSSGELPPALLNIMKTPSVEPTPAIPPSLEPLPPPIITKTPALPQAPSSAPAETTSGSRETKDKALQPSGEKEASDTLVLQRQRSASALPVVKSSSVSRSEIVTKKGEKDDDGRLQTKDVSRKSLPPNKSGMSLSVIESAEAGKKRGRSMSSSNLDVPDHIKNAGEGDGALTVRAADPEMSRGRSPFGGMGMFKKKIERRDAVEPGVVQDPSQLKALKSDAAYALGSMPTFTVPVVVQKPDEILERGWLLKGFPAKIEVTHTTTVKDVRTFVKKHVLGDKIAGSSLAIVGEMADECQLDFRPTIASDPLVLSDLDDSEKIHDAMGGAIARKGANADPYILLRWEGVKMDDTLDTRSKVLEEFMHTEESYIAVLLKMSVIKCAFAKFVQERGVGKSLSTQLAKDFPDIFSNLDSLLISSHELLKQIRMKLHSWTKESLIGEVFVKLAPIMLLYTEWSSKYKNALELVKKYRTFPKVQAFLKRFEASPELPLESHLIQPIQRLPRYVLLLNQLQKHTDQDHVDYGNLVKASKVFKDICDRVNANVKQNENVSVLVETLPPAFESMVVAHRQMVLTCRSKCRIQTVGKIPYFNHHLKIKEQLVIFVFNDMVAFCNEKEAQSRETRVNKIPIEMVWVAGTDGSNLKGGSHVKAKKDKTALVLFLPNLTITVSLKDKGEVIEWNKTLRALISEKIAKSNENLEQQLMSSATVTKLRDSAAPSSSTAVLGNIHSAPNVKKSLPPSKSRAVAMTEPGTPLPSRGSVESRHALFDGRDAEKANATTPPATPPAGRNAGEQPASSPGPVLQLMVEPVAPPSELAVPPPNERMASMHFSTSKIPLPVRTASLVGKEEDPAAGASDEGSSADGVAKKEDGGPANAKSDGKLAADCPESDDDTSTTTEAETELVLDQEEESVSVDELKKYLVMDEIHRWGKYTFNSGAEYIGQWLFGAISGYGVLKANGNTYEGLWENGLQHGHGEILFFDGRRYIGAWKFGRLHGAGKMTFPNKSVYVGEFVEDEISGKGKLYFKNGDTYEGDFVNGRMDGQGKLESRVGWSYVGSFSNNNINGTGKFVDGAGKVYDGEWKNGVRHGKGKYIDGSGNVYEGEFYNNVMHGEGLFCTKNGYMYDGAFVNGVREGKAEKMLYPDGSAYVGGWKNNLRDGPDGKLILKDGSLYHGGWMNDMMHGKGVMKVGAVTLEGTWRNGRKDGTFMVSVAEKRMSQQNLMPKESILTMISVHNAPSTTDDTVRGSSQSALASLIGQEDEVVSNRNLVTELNYNAFDCSELEIASKSALLFLGEKKRSDVRFSASFKDDHLVEPTQHTWMGANCTRTAPTFNTMPNF